ncbi:MAG: efflux RND transporter periplasmic adaptor subunit [Planctomycetes bacterium]|nr:efflux RND transporter periplasmic adaptor subunit [Planctomycetota bacterium]
MREKVILLLLCLFCATVHAQADRSASSLEAIRAVTRPSADVQLSFVLPGRVALMMQKDGASIQAGDKLVQLDDAVEQVALAQIRAVSQDRTQILASQASLDQKRVDLKKLEKAAAARAVTKLEVEHAKLDVTIAELALKVAMFEHSQANLKLEETLKRIDNMRLLSPIAGVVEQITIEVGECVNAFEPMMRIVKIDPLWMEVDVPLSMAMSLTKKHTVQVVFPGSDAQTTVGQLLYISSVADAGSSTLNVRVEVPNKSARPAGEHVRVLFGSPK